MKFVVTGGGTGGHIYPALAIAKALQEHYNAQIYYIGGTKGIESKIVPNSGFPFRAIPLEGFERKLSLHNFKVVFRAADGIRQSIKFLKEIKPDGIIGTGGYVCGPVVLGGFLLGIPTFIHEQNAFPGMTNKILSRFAKAVMLTFDESRERFPKGAKTKLTGLPIRQEIFQIDKKTAREELEVPQDALLVLSFGGSQGAANLNKAILEVLNMFSQSGENSRYIFHVTGPKNYDLFMRNMEEGNLTYLLKDKVRIFPYLENMPLALVASDLVICRAGATTLAELTGLGLPSILVPYPYAAENHQEFNARSLEQKGAGKVILDSELNGYKLFKTIEELTINPNVLLKMGQKSREMGEPKAVENIIKEINLVLKSHN